MLSCDAMTRAKLIECHDRLMSTESNIAGRNSRLVSALCEIRKENHAVDSGQ